MYLRSSRAESISWKSRKTRASSYNRLIPRTILQNDGCGRMNGPSRNWTIENKRNETIDAYTPLSDIQFLEKGCDMLDGDAHSSFITTLFENILSGRYVCQRTKGEGEGG